MLSYTCSAASDDTYLYLNHTLICTPMLACLPAPAALHQTANIMKPHTHLRTNACMPSCTCSAASDSKHNETTHSFAHQRLHAFLHLQRRVRRHIFIFKPHTHLHTNACMPSCTCSAASDSIYHTFKPHTHLHTNACMPSHTCTAASDSKHIETTTLICTPTLACLPAPAALRQTANI